jgi:hypothetical protein
MQGARNYGATLSPSVGLALCLSTARANRLSKLSGILGERRAAMYAATTPLDNFNINLTTTSP